MSGGNTGGNDALRGQLAALTALPPLPATVDALLRLTDAPSAEAVAACARRDPALLACLLKRRDGLASPELLAKAAPLPTLLAGLAPALAAQLIANGPAFDGGTEDAYATLVWPRAIRTACLAEALARTAGATEESAERAYAVGLLLDTGAAALYRLDAAHYGPILRAQGADLPALLSAERAQFDMTHSLAGRILADAWELPAEVRRHIWLQYQPRPAPAGTAPEQVLTLVLHWARRLAWGEQPGDLESAAQDLAAPVDAVRHAAESAGDRADALVQSAPAAAMEPDAFRTRLSAFIAVSSRSSSAEELAWAEQALMAGEGHAAHALPSAAPHAPLKPAQTDAAAAITKALQSPIRRITTGANALLTETGAADPVLLRALHEQGQLAERILQDALAFTQPTTPKPEPQLLNYFLRRFFQAIEERLRWHGVRVELHLAEGLSRIPLDRAAFEQVLLNLAANAAQAMGELGGVLTVSTEAAANNGVIVRVADSGRGLDAALTHTAFEPFVKGPHSGEGPGLGLTAARAIITAHGGRIALEQGAERGAVCTMTLPVSAHAPSPEPKVESPEPRKQPPTAAPPETAPPKAAQAEAAHAEAAHAETSERPLLRMVDVQANAPQSAAAAPGSAGDARDPKRLLMADPDFELGELLHELLGRRGFEVVYLRDPAQALATAAAASFGQILVDAALIAPDGRPLAQALHEVLPGARVILTVTPGAPSAGAIEGMSALRLEKPFPVRALLSALQPAGSSPGR